MRDNNEQMSGNHQARAKFKQRIAGGAVLLIVLAIFLPFIFNHSHLGATTEATAPADNNAVANVNGSAAQQPAVSNDQVQSSANTTADPAVQQADQQQLAPADQSAAANQAQPAVPAATADPASTGTAAPQAAQQDPAIAANTSTNQPGLTPLPNEEATTTAQAAPQPIAASQPVATTAQAEVQQQQPAALAAVAQPAASIPKPAVTAVHHTHANTNANTNTGRWVVQVGSFTQTEYAVQLSKQLRAHGMHAYTHREPNQLVRVYVGPLASKQQAQQVQNKIQAQLQLSSLVIEKRA